MTIGNRKYEHMVDLDTTRLYYVGIWPLQVRNNKVTNKMSQNSTITENIKLEMGTTQHTLLPWGNNLQYRINETVKVTRNMYNNTIKRIYTRVFFFIEWQKRFGDHINLWFNVYHNGDLSKIVHIGSTGGKYTVLVTKKYSSTYIEMLLMNT